jgi:muramoyltetrapeptide carboxypeptidase
LDQLAGLIIGGMSDMNDNAIPYGKSAVEIIAEHLAEYDYPVMFNFPAGHIERNLALPLGKQAKMVVGIENKLSFT